MAAADGSPNWVLVEARSPSDAEWLCCFYIDRKDAITFQDLWAGLLDIAPGQKALFYLAPTDYSEETSVCAAPPPRFPPPAAAGNQVPGFNLRPPVAADSLPPQSSSV